MTYHKIVIYFGPNVRLHLQRERIGDVILSAKKQELENATKILLQYWRDGDKVFQLDITNDIKPQYELIGRDDV